MIYNMYNVPSSNHWNNCENLIIKQFSEIYRHSHFLFSFWFSSRTCLPCRFGDNFGPSEVCSFVRLQTCLLPRIGSQGCHHYIIRHIMYYLFVFKYLKIKQNGNKCIFSLLHVFYILKRGENRKYILSINTLNLQVPKLPNIN